MFLSIWVFIRAVPYWRVRAGDLVLTVAEAAAQVRDRRRGDPVEIAFPPAAVLRLEES